MEFDLLPLVGKGVNPFLVAAQRHEIAALVVAGEEGGKVGIDLGLKLVDAGGGGEFRFHPLNIVHGIWIDLQLSCCGDGFIQFLLLFGKAGGLKPLQCGANGGQQIVVKEAFHLGPLGVHDAVDAEIQVRLIQLEHLAELVFQLIEFTGHGVPFCVRKR